MKITILSVPGCPNVSVLRARLDEALGGRDVCVEMVEIADIAAAERWGMTGSPTILIDGADPFAGSGPGSGPGSGSGSGQGLPALACRTDGGPALADLRNALDAR